MQESSDFKISETPNSIPAYLYCSVGAPVPCEPMKSFFPSG